MRESCMQMSSSLSLVPHVRGVDKGAVDMNNGGIRDFTILDLRSLGFVQFEVLRSGRLADFDTWHKL